MEDLPQVAAMISMKVYPVMRYVLFGLLLLVLLALAMSGSDRRPILRTITREVRLSDDSARVQIIHRPSPKHIRGRLSPHGTSLKLDTIVNEDTLSVEVSADSLITIKLLPAPRFLDRWVKYQRRDSIIHERQIELLERPWYESPLLVLIGALLGFLIALIL